MRSGPDYTRRPKSFGYFSEGVGMNVDGVIYNLSDQFLEEKKNWLRTDGPTNGRTERSTDGQELL